MSESKKKLVGRLAAFGVLGLSALAVAPGSVSAWGPWGGWAGYGQFSTCSAAAGNGTFYACTGKGAAMGGLLAAYTTNPACAKKTRARGWPKKSDGTYVTVIANNKESQSTSSPVSLTHSQCQCEHFICGPD